LELFQAFEWQWHQVNILSGAFKRLQMTQMLPPTIDPLAAQRWQSTLVRQSPWLHEEVARRMEQRLDWIKVQPQAWVNWAAALGGMRAHEAILKRYPGAVAYVHEPAPAQAQQWRESSSAGWWKPSHWRRSQQLPGLPADGGAQMLWANMALHVSAHPQALLAQWHRTLAVDGFVMFSCFGPDTLKEIKAVYAEAGWPQPCHEFTDMHDWGDMLVEAGFAEPVMDMERVVLTFETSQRLIQELRELGRNLNKARFAACRGPVWRAGLLTALARHPALTQANPGQLSLTFEIIYGHAFKPVPRLRLGAESTVSLQEMKSVLRQGKKKSPHV
jgi:malonyl-CoA O-methyltransferase